MTKETLTADDWIKAGFRALSKGGPQAIKAEAIARALGVSKGSFYWHFKNVPALKTSMLKHWKETATEEIIGFVRENAASPEDQIKLLVEIATSDRSDPYGGKLVEAAIRDWARFDKEAAKILKAVDDARLAFLRALFAECGTPDAQLDPYANILYGGLIGLEQISHRENVDLQGNLAALLALLLRGRE